MADDYINDLADPTILDRAIKASGTAEEQKPYMVMVDKLTGKVIEAWKGSHRRTAIDVNRFVQYPVKTTNLAAARRHGEEIHKQRGKGLVDG